MGQLCSKKKSTFHDYMNKMFVHTSPTEIYKLIGKALQQNEGLILYLVAEASIEPNPVFLHQIWEYSQNKNIEDLFKEVWFYGVNYHNGNTPFHNAAKVYLFGKYLPYQSLVDPSEMTRQNKKEKPHLV